MNGYLEIICRSIAVYLFIVLAFKFFGKVVLAQLRVTDLVFVLLISNSVQNAMVDVKETNTLLGGVIAALTLFILNYFFRQIKPDDPLLLVQDGIIKKDNLESIGMTEEELLAAAREHGVESIDKVNLAVLEADGNISILSSNFHYHTRKKRPHKIVHKQ